MGNWRCLIAKFAQSITRLPDYSMTRFESPDRLLDLPCQRLVVIADESQGRAEHHADAPGPRHAPGVVQHLVEADDSHRYDGDVQPRRHHPDPGEKSRDLAG